jgi:hypothetical protein
MDRIIPAFLSFLDAAFHYRSLARCLWMTRKRNCFDVSNRDK